MFKPYLYRIGFFILTLTLIFSLSSCASKKVAKVKKLEVEKEKVSEEEIPFIKSSQFNDPDNFCLLCHRTIYDQWKGSMHNNSYQDPVFQKVLAVASRDTNGKIDKYCAFCHTPIGVMSREFPPLDGSKLSEIAKKGIQCDFCHTISGSKGIGNCAFISSPGPVKRGPFKDSISVHDTAYSELHTKGEFCGMCHNVNHPENNLALEKTYTEWKEGPYPREGIQCQDCHMTPGPGVTKPNPGQASQFGPMRPHIYTHEFVGGNAVVTALLGSALHQMLAEERLKAAAQLEIVSSPKVTLGAKNEVQVKVTNKGAGHYLPTGLTEVRQIWLDFKVTSADGKVIYHSGKLDTDGEIDPKAVIYHTILGDKNGKPTEKVWFAEKILSDKRIPPKETVTEKYFFEVPVGIQLPLTIEVILKYRSAPQHLIDELFGKKKIILPIIEMTTAKAQIQ